MKSKLPCILVVPLVAALRLSGDCPVNATPGEITLHLKPGYHGDPKYRPPVSLATPRVPISPGALSVAVPLYPGAVPEALNEDCSACGYPLSPYLKSATTVYRVPTDADTVLHWYRKSFAAIGYSAPKANGLSGWTDARGRTIETSFIEFKSADHRDQELTVCVSVRHERGHHSSVSYFATAITTPPRPSDSYIPAEIKEVEITRHVYFGAATDKSNVIKTIIEPKEISALITAFNAMPLDSEGSHHGTNATHYWEVVFIRQDGSKLNTTVDPAHRLAALKDFPLFDCDLKFDQLLTDITKP